MIYVSKVDYSLLNWYLSYNNDFFFKKKKKGLGLCSGFFSATYSSSFCRTNCTMQNKPDMSSSACKLAIYFEWQAEKIGDPMK